MNYFASSYHQTFNGLYTEIKNALGSDSELLMKVLYLNTPREEPDLKQTYVLASAFRDGNDLVPVNLTVKEFKDGKDNKLHVAISTQKIEGAFAMQTSQQTLSDFLHSAPSKTSLAYLLENVKDSDNHFTKYIPQQFRNKHNLYKFSDSSHQSESGNVGVLGGLSENGTQMYAAMSKIPEGARERYGIGEATIDKETGEFVGYANSTAQADIDRRLGIEFRFEDNTSRSRVSDLNGNSLHLSDSVIFEVFVNYFH